MLVTLVIFESMNSRHCYSVHDFTIDDMKLAFHETDDTCPCFICGENWDRYYAVPSLRLLANLLNSSYKLNNTCIIHVTLSVSYTHYGAEIMCY